MFSGIRGRLLGSYLLLLTMMLAVMSVTLVAILSARPAPSDPIYRELLTFAQSFVFNGMRNIRPFQNRNDTVVIDSLVSYADEIGVRVLIATLDDNTVLLDSAEQISVNSPLNILDAAVPVENRLRSIGGQQRPFMNAAPNEYQLGRFVDGGQEWLFVAFPFPRVGESGMQVLLADERPTSSLIEALDDFSAEIGMVLLQATLVGLMMAALLALLISRTLAKPLQNLSAASAAIASGDYAQRVPLEGPREMREVAAAFNRMSEQVQLNNQAQQDLLANVSHDLKTPLTSIQGFSQAIMDGTASDVQKAAGIIYEESARLTRLVLQLTELTRLKSGRATMRQDKVDFSALVDAMSDKLAIMAQQKHIRIEKHISRTVALSGDGDKLAQVVNNLISNAIKYTPPQGHVVVSVSQNGDGINFNVQDSGIGIPPDEISRVFERFYQVDKSRGLKRGHGLGLAITQEIVAAHNGKISVWSEGENKGSTFMVWLPQSG